MVEEYSLFADIGDKSGFMLTESDKLESGKLVVLLDYFDMQIDNGLTIIKHYHMNDQHGDRPPLFAEDFVVGERIREEFTVFRRSQEEIEGFVKIKKWVAKHPNTEHLTVGYVLAGKIP